MSIITLTTDFGLEDAYVGMMKGVILGVNPSAVIVDVTHGLNPQNVVQGAFTVSAAYGCFPAGTVHLVVVDPGVGGERRIIALALNGHRFIGPDNGLFQLVLGQEDQGDQGKIEALVAAERSDLFRQPLSRTFHGRDIMAPLAAHLSLGMALEALGPEIPREDLVPLDYRPPRIARDGTLAGVIVSIDHFGNLITDLHARRLADLYPGVPDRKMMVTVGGRRIPGLSRTYSAAQKHRPLALVGSSGYVEIAVNCGSAQSYFQAAWGDRIAIEALHGSTPIS